MTNIYAAKTNNYDVTLKRSDVKCFYIKISLHNPFDDIKKNTIITVSVDFCTC